MLNEREIDIIIYDNMYCKQLGSEKQSNFQHSQSQYPHI